MLFCACRARSWNHVYAPCPPLSSLLHAGGGWGEHLPCAPASRVCTWEGSRDMSRHQPRSRSSVSTAEEKAKGRQLPPLAQCRVTRTQRSQTWVPGPRSLSSPDPPCLAGDSETPGETAVAEAVTPRPVTAAASADTSIYVRERGVALPWGWLFRKGRNGADPGRTGHPQRVSKAT